jgi:RHS repeat-associated protein
MRQLLVLALAVAPVLLAEEPQAVRALEHLKAKPAAGPFSWTAGEYQYDGAGNIKAIGNESFVYDKVGRIKSATLRGPDLSSLQAQTFNYDVYGNLTSTSKLGQTVDLSAEAESNRLSGASYDARGNVIGFGGQQYDYDAVGMLSSVRLISATQPRIIYAYTADDERLFAFDVSASTTHWTLRGFDNKVLRDFKQVGATWSVERDYVYRGGLLLAALKPGGAVEHYTLDHLGTPRLITDGTGHKIGYHAYWPFGEEWSPGNAREGAPLKFTGHERDVDPSGFDYMHARYYQAAWGRFLAVDPVLGEPTRPQSWNRYAYVRNSPLLLADPTGRNATMMCDANSQCVVSATVQAVRDPNDPDAVSAASGFKQRAARRTSGSTQRSPAEPAIRPIGDCYSRRTERAIHPGTMASIPMRWATSSACRTRGRGPFRTGAPAARPRTS